MIPLRLQLKNFLSYGSDIQTIDFSTYPLICLSGKNGHGKSALLDAITWALWGQARKVSGQSKADQGLLRLGQTQMMVALDFEFNGNLYRIRREFAFNYGKPYAALDFGLVDENDTLIPLTDKTISTTQAKIEQTLNLTFESFSNSAFLRQGQSNEFSKKSPKERKEILASILGLDHYETVRKLAFDKIRTAQTEKVSRMAIQEKIENELKAHQDLNALTAEITEHLRILETKAQEIAFKKTTLETENKLLIQDQNKYELLLFKQEQLHNNTAELTATMRATFHEWRTVHKQQLALPDMHDLETKKRVALAELTKHQELLQKNLELKELILKNKELLHAITQKLQTEYAQELNKHTIQRERLILENQAAENNCAQITKAIAQYTQEKELITQKMNAAQEILVKDDAIIHTLNVTEKQFERRKEHYQKFLEQGRWLTTELENLEQKKELAHDDNDPSCPLCEQTLSAARKRFLKQKFAEQEQFLRHRLQRITIVVRQLKIVLIDQHKELEITKKIAEQALMLKHQMSEYEKCLATIKRQTDECVEQQKTLLLKRAELVTAITQQEQLIAKTSLNGQAILANNSLYKQTQTIIAETEQQLHTMPYNPQEHQKINALYQILEKTLNNAQALNTQIAQQEQRQQSIMDACNKLKTFKKEAETLSAALARYQILQVKVRNLTDRSAALDQEIKQHAHEKEISLHKKATLEAQKNAALKLEQEHKDELRIMGALDSTIYDYQAIAAATSKDGIQALLIEDAIPEIEQEANYLLSRLTNNQAHIFIESLRDLKKGGTKETLDIKISDAAGIRPYEMFSGGEAFRIDFALRIAISKLLARRAGTSLQTLIIDEGFGSQDEDGLALIMDAMYKIQEDFAKVIIVSHLPAMKDQFPVHFAVDKGPNGSIVSVIEQG